MTDIAPKFGGVSVAYLFGKRKAAAKPNMKNIAVSQTVRRTLSLGGVTVPEASQHTAVQAENVNERSYLTLVGRYDSLLAGAKELNKQYSDTFRFILGDLRGPTVRFSNNFQTTCSQS